MAFGPNFGTDIAHRFPTRVSANAGGRTAVAVCTVPHVIRRSLQWERTKMGEDAIRAYSPLWCPYFVPSYRHQRLLHLPSLGCKLQVIPRSFSMQSQTVQYSQIIRQVSRSFEISRDPSSGAGSIGSICQKDPSQSADLFI